MKLVHVYYHMMTSYIKETDMFVKYLLHGLTVLVNLQELGVLWLKS